MSKTSKALYLPLSIATSVTGGVLAGAVFGQIWKRFSDQEPAPPDPKDLNNSSRAALLGAGLHTEGHRSRPFVPPAGSPANSRRRSASVPWTSSSTSTRITRSASTSIGQRRSSR